MYPPPLRLPLLILITALSVPALALAGCGGGSSGGQGATQLARGPGFSFQAPADWKLVVTRRSATALPHTQGAQERVSVTQTPLLKRFRAQLWPKVVRELDRTVADLAGQLHADLSDRRSLEIAGRRARQYQLDFMYQGHSLSELLTSLFRGRSQYQLLCRWQASDSRPEACDLLLRSYRLR